MKKAPYNQDKIIYGMIHVGPLPGTPFYEQKSFSKILDLAVLSAEALYKGGANGCLVQTVDRVYDLNDEVDPARIVSLSLIVNEIKKATKEKFGIGVQIMKNAIKPSLAIAKVAGGSFIRASALVGMSTSEFGLVIPKTLEILEYRNKIEAGNIEMIADITTRHYKQYGSNLKIDEIAALAFRVGADGVCVEDSNDDDVIKLVLKIKQRFPNMPVFIAGGTDLNNITKLLSVADGAFVGTCIQKNGWGGQIDLNKVKKYIEKVRYIK